MPDLLSMLAAPIPGENPFGADVNHDPDYESLKGEIGKLGDIDVDAVEALSIKILTEKSKDIRAMAWLAYAALRKGEVGLLADVICLLVGYCADSFESVFPLRDGAKLAALRWLSEPRFTSRCPGVDAGVSDAPHIVRLKDALSKWRPVLEKKFPLTGAPFPSLLYKRVMEWDRAVSAQIKSNAGTGSIGGGDSVTPSANQSISPSVDKSIGISVDNPVDLDKPTRTDDRPRPPAASGGKTNGQATVSIKLTHNEYQEIITYIGRMETLLKKIS
ncbi:MAG: type VI secretion system ImpA family N-terminal domain-containing protein [Chitinispirillia bacterium]|nr:type VI secretion system ImpA family N-terminal domain-containing protein [Chitinispirillia bacterium]